MLRKTDRIADRFRPAAWAAGAALSAWVCGTLAGCTMLDMAAPTATQPTALSSLTNWFSQPMEMAPGFDVETIRPDARPVTIAAGNLLEITIWDLYEPGKPYSFPVRVSDRLTVEVPFLGEVAVAERTLPEVEKTLVENFRKGEYLLNPKLLVRSLDSPTVKVHVAGAVNRGGFVELTRADSSVYAAILSAGGLKKTAGTQVGVTRRSLQFAAGGPIPADARTDRLGASPAEATAAPAATPHMPALRANPVDDLSVSPAAPKGHAQLSNQSLFSVVDGDRPGSAQIRDIPPTAPRESDPSTVWFDASLPHDCERLKALQLTEGDTVTVKAGALPLRIGGVVSHPGAYPLPAGRSLNVWQAIDQAGGIRSENVPLNITLLRPAGEGHSARRWSLNVAAYDQHPTASPLVEPGDVLHVEPTTGSKIKRAVGDLWNKP